MTYKSKFGFLFCITLCVQQYVCASINSPTQINPQNNASKSQTLASFQINPVTGATFYEIDYSENILITSAIRVKSYYSDQSLAVARSLPLKFNTRYYWRARSRTSTDSSTWSSVWNFTTDTNIVITYPSNNQGPVNINVNFIWFRCDKFQTYMLEIDTSSSFSSSKLIRYRINDTFLNTYYVSLLETKLYFNTTYFCRVKGINSTDSMHWLPTRKFWTIDTTKIINPANKLINQKTNTRIEISVDQYASYQLEVDTSAGFNTFKRHLYTIKGQDALQYYLRNLEFDQTYYWRLRTLAALDTSRWSFIRKFTVQGMKNKNVILTPPVPGPQVAFLWNLVDTAKAYQFQVDTLPNFKSPFLKDSLRFAVYNPSNLAHDKSVVIKELPFGINLYQRVRPMHSMDTGAWSNTKLSQIPALPYTIVPANFSVNVTINALFQWQSLLGVKYYRFQRDKSPNFNSSELLDTLVNVSFSKFPTMAYNTVYYWRVLMMHDMDTSEWSLSAKITTQAKPTLKLPTNSKLFGPGVAAKLTWDTMSGTKQFMVQYDTSSSFNSTILRTMYVPGDSAFANIKDLFFGKLYCWRVRAIHLQDSSDWSAVSYFLTEKKVRLSLPDNFMNNVNFTSLDWNSIYGSTGYHYIMAKDSSLKNAFEGKLSAVNPFFHAFVSNPTQFNTKYFWKIRVFHSKDTSDWSDVWNFTTRKRNGVVLRSIDSGNIVAPLGIKFVWDKITDATQYVFGYSERADFSNALYVLTVSTNTVLSLKPNTTYYWKVTAKNIDGILISDTSETWKFTTVSNFITPILFTPADKSVKVFGAVNFTWSAILGAGYDFDISNDSMFVNHQLNSLLSNSTILNGLGSNLQYYWRVRATNPFVAGPWSPIFTFSTPPAGIEEISAESLYVFPNPATDILNIVLPTLSKTKEIRIVNISGITVYSSIINSESTLIDVSKFQKGFYLVYIQVDDGILLRKLLIQ